MARFVSLGPYSLGLLWRSEAAGDDGALPVRVLGKLFRRLFLTRLLQLRDHRRLPLRSGCASC